MTIDSHCHLDSEKLAGQTEAVLARARAAGVRGCVTIATKLSAFPQVLAIAERFANVWCSVGSHPEEASAEPLTSPEALLRWAAHPKVVGIG